MKFNKNYLERAELCHAGGWTDMTKLILTFRNFAFMTKKAVLLIGTTLEGQKCNI